MEVVKIRNNQGKERYYVVDDHGNEIIIILKFIKFKDNIGYSRNSLKMYCYHLKLYFEYLEEKNKEFQNITVDDLALFVNWLQTPYNSFKIASIVSKETTRCATTINKIVDTVTSFYDYIFKHEEYSNNISEKVKKVLTSSNKNFKGFLFGIAYKNEVTIKNTLKLKEPIKKPKTLKKEQIEEIYNECNNLRDKFLISLLYETGMRIGEALSLWLEDIDIANKTVEIKDRGQLENNAEIKTVTSPRTIDVSQNIIDIFMEYIEIYHTEDVLTNHIFIKIKGKNKNKAMNYVDVDNLFRYLNVKIGIHTTAHMFRHSSLTTLRKNGWEPELLRVRAGHKNIYTTLNAYIHPSSEEIRDEFKRVEENFKMKGDNNNV
ncbi:MAG: tyrosine-type recombinase/integrase [Bacilli bacterium]|nr:tyrosine-type recombinase/integrase [Bacilli bacterium]